jgi:hypothetical protein
MSIKVSSWVWQHSKQKSTKLLMLLALADSCDDDGVCYPGIKYLAKKARVSRDRASKILKELRDAGELRSETHQGVSTAHGNTNRYYLLGYRKGIGIEDKIEAESSRGVKNDPPGGLDLPCHEGFDLTPYPLEEPSEEPTTFASPVGNAEPDADLVRHLTCTDIQRMVKGIFPTLFQVEALAGIADFHDGKFLLAMTDYPGLTEYETEGYRLTFEQTTEAYLEGQILCKVYPVMPVDEPPKPKKESRSNPWYDAVVKVFELYGGRNTLMIQMLMGMATKNGHKEYNLPEPLTSADDILKFGRWWKTNHDGLTMVQSPAKVQSEVMGWQAKGCPDAEAKPKTKREIALERLAQGLPYAY